MINIFAVLTDATVVLQLYTFYGPQLRASLCFFVSAFDERLLFDHGTINVRNHQVKRSATRFKVTVDGSFLAIYGLTG